jgi:hypothetical protein
VTVVYGFLTVFEETFEMIGIVVVSHTNLLLSIATDTESRKGFHF